MRAGDFYHQRGSYASAANRLSGVVDQYPLYSRADEALWMEGDSYSRLGPRFRAAGRRCLRSSGSRLSSQRCSPTRPSSG